jgi:hypothetical protein
MWRIVVQHFALLISLTIDRDHFHRLASSVEFPSTESASNKFQFISARSCHDTFFSLNNQHLFIIELISSFIYLFLVFCCRLFFVLSLPTSTLCLVIARKERELLFGAVYYNLLRKRRRQENKKRTPEMGLWVSWYCPIFRFSLFGS